MSGNLQNNFGDSVRNGAECSSKTKMSLKMTNHVFDGAGENIHYYSDSESTKAKARYINPAICVETIEVSRSVTSLTDTSSYEDLTPHPHGSYNSTSTPFLTGRVSNSSSKRKSCHLPLLQDLQHNAEETARYNTYRGSSGQNTFRLSVASLTTTATAKDEREYNEQKKEEAFKQWVARKQQEKREKARMEKVKQQVVPVTTAEQREESYRRWLERKRKQNENRRAEDLMRTYREKEKIKMKQMKREQEKEEKLAVWIRKKQEDMKSMKTKEERKAALVAIEEERRRVKGEQAYRDWLRTSKKKPLPVPLNQGELSMRGSVSQMYINPVPWQSLV